jgi:hypothetical protein
MSINRISRQVVPGNHQEVPIGQHSCDRLLKGTALMDVQEKNRYLVQTWGYCGMPADMQTKHTYQWLLTKNNVSSLYWQYHRVLGMHVHEAAHVNLDEWLDPKSAHYNKTLAASIFHYEAWAAKGKRVKVCIATDEMKRAVWKYGHDSQIILNSTFGLCNRWILCFIVMSIDEDQKGVPLAFLLFSAPARSKQTAAGYNYSIITQLLTQ